jgi:hypothetical protein
MKKIKLEVVVDNEVAGETLLFLQKVIINNIREYNLSMEDYGLLPYGPTLGEIENA